MQNPVIGITTYNDKTAQGYPAVILMRAYLNAIINSNGIPVLIPPGLPEEASEELFRRVDGILFTGGGDIAVLNYGGEDHPSISNVDFERDALEIPLMKAAIKQNKPFLGICRGFQLMNVVLGGYLYSDLTTQKRNSIKHDYYPDIPRNYPAHKVEIATAGKLAGILGSHLVEVNSLHHQGIKEIGLGIEPVGLAPDGLIEAVEVIEHPFGIAVQWHPEWMVGNGSMVNLFSAFTDAARKSIKFDG